MKSFALLLGLGLAFFGVLTFAGFIIFGTAFGTSFVVNFYAVPFVNAFTLFVTAPFNYVDLPIALAFLLGGLVLIVQGAKRDH